ncbi:tyrosine-type recombinase/integrase [Bacillus salipaludis]|uniref:tyrosine-type recombinase/integrase n=1 Tax=Bacillus salipaludis TaxID=2547811 RepID=UPI002E1F5FAF|nr:tyrosine-type recombinase/integrase [Bacillus salipaludis]
MLIGYLLFTTGFRASELLSLNWGSFRYNRKGFLIVDVIGKGNKPRSIPIRDETKDILFSDRICTGETVEINMQDISPLFFALYNKNEHRVNKKRLSCPALFTMKEAV